MATFVLVHGAWHGAWCWRDVTPLLESAGHRVLAPDLPGHGEDFSPVAEMTLDAYARRVRETVDEAAEPVVLVGHSMGGIVVTQAAEQVPDRVTRLVYVTAFLPGDGQSLADLAHSVEGGDRVQPNLVVDGESGTCVVAEDALVDVFYGECSPENVAYATARLVPEALAVVVAPVRVTDGGAGRIPRVYVECSNDRGLTLPLQRHMQSARPCGVVLELDADHSPFLSRPRELARHLLSLT
ncbi:MAG TPA: alpha/beta fold hydrolase [Gaiellaceae bacterium]|nr:alpha/beta fold hydrolase [Gaiellaceae bacterium]